MDEQRRKRIVRHHLRCLGRLGVSTGPKRISADGVVAKPGRQARQKPRSRRRTGNYFRRCHLPVPGYDQLAERRFELIHLWGFLVFLLYSMRRVDCRRCGVVAVEEVPWGDGKRTLTKAYMLFLARWARRLSWKETAEAFRTSWDKVFDAVEHVVTFGLEHRVLGKIDAIGVDDIQ